MVIAHHLVWTTYGTWLPNDPRGSWSQSIASPLLAELGAIHFGRRKVQPPRQAVREFYAEAEPRLIHPIIRFDSHQIELVAAALSQALHEFNYTCYACAIMPDHVHLLIRKHRDVAETMIDNLQKSTRATFIGAERTPPADHPLWTAGGWKRFLATPDAVGTVVRYIEANPVKIGQSRQIWPFAKPYDGWPFHKGGQKPRH